ncbi:uncharacterized protein LOC111376170 [Olea europaea var. sylvestris]|uniref:uncharacterized protein LOC111376170 n=1 Tax=Olea europaea var. sylvestris TaxID=158386 RepID=UPI000C1CD0D1|nr:uncharacterized protein LOC111376170 [Olea europaea var. sylvestris]
MTASYRFNGFLNFEDLIKFLIKVIPVLDAQMGDQKQPNERSEIWNHFTRILDRERAKCNYCWRTFKADTNNETSSMWKHLKICYAYKSTRVDDNQQHSLEKIMMGVLWLWCLIMKNVEKNWLR